MVTFNCEVCNGTVPKKQTEKHYYKCPNAYYTCIDCNKTFDDGYSYQQHTVCITEDEKYQGKLFKGKNKKNGDTKKNGDIKQNKEEIIKAEPEKGKSKEESKKSQSKEGKDGKSTSKEEKPKENELNTLLTKGDSLYKIIKKLDDNKNLKKKLLKSLVVDTNGELKIIL